MFTISSNTESEADLAAVISAAGGTIVSEEKAPVEEVKAEVKEVKSEEPGKPGAKDPAEPETKTIADPEPAKPESQVEPPQAPVEPEKPKSKGGFQAKLEKKTAELERVRDELETERGDKTRLKDKLAELQAQVDKLVNPTVEVVAEGPKRPQRPKRGDMSKWDFDEGKFDEALATYEEELSNYHQQVSQNTIKEALDKSEAERQQKEAQTTADRRVNEYLSKVREDAKVIEDFDDMMASLEDDVAIPDVIRGVLMEECEHPSEVLYFLAKDQIENDGSELKRLSALSPIKQAAEVTRLHDRLAREREARLTPKKEVKVAEEAPKPEVVKPVKVETKREVPEAPLAETVVGGRSAQAKAMTLEEAAALGGEEGQKRYLEIRKRELLAKQARR